MKQWSYTDSVLKALAGLLVLTMMMMVQPRQSPAQMDQTKPGPAWLQNMHHEIEQYSGLDTAQREQMRANLDRCLVLGMTADRVGELFPQEHAGSPERARDLLMMQNRILAAGEAGLPLEPMIEKIREGRMKHVRSGMMTQVLAQTDHNLRVSDRMTREVVNGGVKPSGQAGAMHNAVVELSRCLWDGLHEEDMEHLGETARMRAQSGECGLGEFVAANEAAARFAQSGVDHSRAVDMAGEALHNGYSARDMYTMANMMMTGTHRDADHQQICDRLDGWIHEGMSMDEMTKHMMDGGWMGPADMMGPGGSHPMNDMGLGGAGHDGGMGDDHDHGGMGGGK